MHHLIKFTLFALMAIVSGAAMAQAGLSEGRVGVGLKSQDTGISPPGQPFSGEALQLWQERRFSDYALYGGTRETPRLGMHPAESYGGVVYSLPRGWGSSFEAGYVQESLLSPRRYALSGQVHTPLRDGKALSVGLRYRIYDTDSGSRFGASGDTPYLNGYTLAPSRQPGAGYAPGYQLRMSYQYSAAGSVGLALGREAETTLPFFDPLGSGPRQLSFTGQHWLTPSWALSYDVLSQDAAAPLRSLGLRLGVRYKF
ncbi:MAG: hypothetical protein HYY78_15475 [Betaproteobacteria bacterium]|nr:hypothetical protein [Betaproteobacteria bacterium]